MAIFSSIPYSFFFWIIFTITTAKNILAPVHGHCLEDQNTLLLELKSELKFDPDYSQKLARWNQKHDCCRWDGVECDGVGRVISLQLDDVSISGGLNESSSLFRLRYLEKLNLANNFFTTQKIPRAIHHLTHLTHLILSNAGFVGQVPIELSLLRRLVVLDISSSSSLDQKLKIPNLKILIRNLTSLREVYLDGVDISGAGSEWCQTISSSLPHLRVLSLRDCKLSGPFCPSLSQLRSLSVVRLYRNNLSTTIPDSLANFSSLTTFSCRDCSLRGSIIPKMILQVPTLQELDLSYNKLLGGTIPQFPLRSALRSIDMSSCGLVGPIPSTVSNLTELVHLDLSYNFLTGVIPSFYMSSKKLTYLDLSHNSLSGSIPAGTIFALPSLEELDLSDNQFSGQINEFSSIVNFSIAFFHIDLSCNKLGGSIPQSFFALPSLFILDLSNNQFSGQVNEFPRVNNSIGLSKLTYLDLRDNSLSGSIPVGTIFALPSLELLALSDNQFSGQINEFSSIVNFSNAFLYIDLSYNKLGGSIPQSFFALPSLEELYLSENQFSGQINEFSSIVNFSVALFHIDLSYNKLGGSIPQSFFALPSISILILSNNQFSGQVKEFPRVNNSIDFLDLSSNRLEGPIPDSFFQLQSLQSLDLSDNLFNGSFDLEKLKRLPNLRTLYLSYNNLSVDAPNIDSSLHGFPKLQTLGLASCNLSDFPDFIKQSQLSDLDLSNNRISGDIPSWIWEIGNGTLFELNLSYNFLVNLQKPYHIPISFLKLDLHSNQIQGQLPPLPQDFFYVDYSNNHFHGSIPSDIIKSNITESLMVFLSLANNSLSGAIPTSLCNISGLAVLDLSFNNFTGIIPPCVVENSTENLQVLNLRGNNINGVIPDQFFINCSLRTLDLSHNNLSGMIPKSLANCQGLEVVNVGYNNFDDRFPCMLSSNLHVLVLRSNRFHGEWRCDKSWPSLQIVDISSNNFSGSLHLLNFSSWKGMMLQNDAHLRPNRSVSLFLGQDSNYQSEVTLTVKGVEVNLVKIWPDFTSIDLSCNNFHGDIPDAIGNLTSLYLLNLSHNALTASIPKSLGALAELGSLDLSANQLRGRIPEELAHLTFLSILNLSYNELVGMIPKGPQFNTFSADSFEGNTGLCGFPVNRSCSNSSDGNGSTVSAKEKDEEIEWEYVCAAMGYVVGLGSIVWILFFCRRFRQRYFDKIEDVVENIFYRRDHRRRRRRKSVRKH